MAAAFTLFACASSSPPVSPAASPSSSQPAAAQSGEASPVFDRPLKCDLVEKLPEPPQLVFFGGSRAQRFEPSVAEDLTGLPAFNFAVQNSRPEDVYAMSRYLFRRAPSVKLRCVWALQATTIVDSPLHPGLLAEPRLTQFLPDDLVAEQRELGTSIEGRKVGSEAEFGPRGNLLYNKYDARVEQGVPLERTLEHYLADMVPRAAESSPYGSERAEKYFERTLQLFNLHGVEPVLLIMPYHPTVLTAFREVGWDAKEQELTRYLESLRGKYDFQLLDYTDIAAFGGDPDEFYDGAHVTAVNARLILAQAVKDAPEAFR